MLYNEYRPCRLLLAVLVVSLAHHATSFQSLRSECYTLDKDNFLYDFTDWIGKEFQYTEAQDGSTYTLRFCKDMQVRSGQSIVNYGRFSPEYSSAQDTTIAFVHEYRYGDLKGCEHEGYDYSGRSSMALDRTILLVVFCFNFKLKYSDIPYFNLKFKIFQGFFFFFFSRFRLLTLRFIVLCTSFFLLLCSSPRLSVNAGFRHVWFMSQFKCMPRSRRLHMPRGIRAVKMFDYCDDGSELCEAERASSFQRIYCWI